MKEVRSMSEDIDITELVKGSVILARLVEEVRLDQAEGRPNAYDRMHNRHNRSIPRIYPRPTPAPTPKPEEPDRTETERGKSNA